jgi:hypothetical protein
MRLQSCFFCLFCAGFASTTWAIAQSPDERGAEEQYEPYHKHYDKHHGHNHAYPDRGAILRELPRGATVVHYAGVSYRFADGVWFEPRGPAFIVVAPSIGLVVATLPSFATRVEHSGESYLYANDIYYRARPDLGGYEVINDPEDTAVPAGAGAAAAPPGGAGIVAAAQTAAALPANPSPPDSTYGVPVAATLTAATPGNAIPTTAQVTTPAALPITSGQAALPPAAPVSAAQIAPSSAIPAASATTGAAGATAAVGAAAQIAAPAVAAAGSSQVMASGPARGTKVVAYPKNGQTPEVQARDHYECYKFAVAQSGFDPMHSGGAAAASIAEEQADYERAQAACFEGRGYTIR